MKDKLQEIVDNVVRDIVQITAQWGEDTPPDFPERAKEVESLIRRFLKEYVLQIFLFGR